MIINLTVNLHFLLCEISMLRATAIVYSLWFMLSTHMTTYCNHTGGVKIVWLEPYVNTWSHGSLVKMALSCAYCIKVCHILDKNLQSNVVNRVYKEAYNEYCYVGAFCAVCLALDLILWLKRVL